MNFEPNKTTTNGNDPHQGLLPGGSFQNFSRQKNWDSGPSLKGPFNVNGLPPFHKMPLSRHKKDNVNQFAKPGQVDNSPFQKTFGFSGA